MKLKKLIRRLSDFLDADKRDQLKEYDQIKKLLKELKIKNERILDQILEADNDEEVIKLQGKLEVIRVQRKKGIKALKDLKELKSK